MRLNANSIICRSEAVIDLRNVFMTRFIFFVLFLGFLFASPAAAQASRPRTPKGMVLVPKGDLRMGTDSSDIGRLMTLYGVKHGDLFTGEVPRHLVKLDAFYMDRYEVSNRDFALFLKKKPTWHKDSMPPKYDNGKYLALWKNGKYPTGTGNLPVTNVNWYAAIAYCHWAGKRLPTEAEWEYAARYAAPGQFRRFAWGDALPVTADVGDLAGTEAGNSLPAALSGYRDEYPVIAPVGKFKATPLGLHDMSGNVSEWIDDYYLSFVDAAPVTDPLGPEDGTRHVIRGANWKSATVTELRLAWRDGADGDSTTIGFRVVRYAE